MVDLTVVPLTIEQAMEYLKKNERHYKSDATPIFAIGITSEGSLCGAAVVGSRGDEAELCHIYSEGEYGGYTTLYGQCWRAIKALGYRRIIP